MAVTQDSFTGNGSTTTYSFTFPYLKASDIKVSLDATATTNFQFTNATTIQFTAPSGGATTTQESGGAPKSGVNILIFRETGIDDLTATFFAGSAIKSEDLNDNFTQNLFVTQEVNNRYLSILGGNTMQANLLLGKGVDIVFEGDIDDPHETTLEVENPTSDRIITLPNVSGNVVTTGDTGTVTSTMITDGTIVDGDIANTTITGGKLVNDTITATQIANNAITVNELADDSVDRAAIVADAVNGSKIADNSIDSEHYVDGSIDHVHLAGDAVDGDNIADDSINSEHYVDGSIDTQHIAADQITNALIADDQIDSEHYVDGSIDHVHLAGDCIDSDNIQDNAVGAEHIQANAVTDSEIATGTLDNRYYTETELNAGQLDNRYFTETELTGGSLDGRYFTESELTGGSLDVRYFTETESDARYFRQDSSETIASGVSWSNSDAHVATTAAINARIIDLVDDVGGFTAIANETSFPDTNPQASSGKAAILSITSIGTARTPSGTTVTIANGNASSNATITITGVPSTLPAGFGVLVESTQTLHTYTFHRLVPKATEITTVAANALSIAAAANNVTDINNFADLYIISSSAPTARVDSTALQEGDLWYDSSNDNIRVYTGSVWSAVTPTQAVLNDISIVSGAVTFQEDLGLITDPVTTGSSNGSLDIVADALEDEVTLTITAATGKFIVDGVDKPALTLYKGWTYTFDVSDASNASHPLRFQSGGSAYSTNVTVTGTQGQAGAKVTIKIPESQPTSFQYYCTSHSGMGNTITVKDDPIKTVADNISNITSVITASTNVNTVATNIANVNNVGSNIANVNAVNSNASNINTVGGSITNVNNVGGSISNVNSVANNLASINSFANTYRIGSSNPTTSLDTGDLFFNTTTDSLKVYTGSAWVDGVTQTGNFALKTGNTFTGDNVYNNNVKAKFGTTPALEIYHSGSHSRFADVGTGKLQFGSDTGTEILTGNFATQIALFDSTQILLKENTTITGLMTATTIDGAAGDNLQLDFGTI